MPGYPRVITWARALALASFVALAALVWVRYSQAMAQVGVITTVQTIGANSRAAMTLLVDAETAARGFVITGDEQYLDPFKRAVSGLPPLIAALLAAKLSDPVQQKRVEDFAASTDRELGVLTRTVETRRGQGFEAARALVQAGVAKKTMEELRLSSDAMVQGARNRVRLDRAAGQQSATITRYLMLFLFWFAVAMLLFAGFQMRRELRRRGRAEMELQRAYQQVEDRVQVRTGELMESNARVASSERRVRLIAELGVVHLFTLKSGGEAEFVTAGFPALTGFDPEQLLGFGWLQALHTEDRPRVTAEWKAAVAGGIPFESIFRLQTANGDFRWFKMRALPVAAEQAGSNQWVAAAIDMNDQQEIAVIRTELLEREQAARAEAELANRLKDDFLATVSHELRTPLNAIVGWVHLLKNGLADDQPKAVAAIERNAFMQARLIDDLLDVSRMMKGRFSLSMSAMDLRSSVQAALETIRPAAVAKQVTLVLNAPDHVPVLGDEARLQQVAWNLLSNAVKFTPKGGTVTVDVSRVGSRARLRATDSGEGIDPAFLPHVFEPFRQAASRTRRAGLGLGLAIVRQIVELHGGTVQATSAGPQRGSTFTVTMPLADARAQIAGLSLEHVSVSGMRVVIAEDDDDSAVTLGAILAHRGCDVRTARSAQECLNVCVEFWPDILLCDIGLPDDDGYSLLRRLRDRHKGQQPLPAIALTAFAREEDRARALAAGFAAHVNKPFDADRLMEEITRVVRRSPVQTAVASVPEC